MTAPLAPVKDDYNRPPKELAGYSSTVVDDGDEITAPSGPPGIPDVIMPFHAVYGYPVSLPDQPAAEIAPADFVPEWYDTKYFSHARLVANIETAGASGAAVRLEYAPDYTAAPTVFADAGTPSSVALRIDQTGALKSPWVRLADDPTTGARRDVVWRPVFGGGDGATTPVIGKLSAQFRFAADLIMEKWFLRLGAPTDAGALGATAPPETTDLFLRLKGYSPPFTIQIPSTQFTSYSLPDASGLGHLSLTKGSTPNLFEVGGSSTSAADIEDYICSFAGPPLAGGQVIPVSSVMVYYKGTSLFTGWPAWRVGIWRPGTGLVADWTVWDDFNYVERRFIPLSYYEYAISLNGNGLALTEDGDRFVVGLGCVVEGTAFSGSQFSVFYEGNYEPVPGENGPAYGASYLLIPKLTYLSLIA